MDDYRSVDDAVRKRLEKALRDITQQVEQEERTPFNTGAAVNAVRRGLVLLEIKRIAQVALAPLPY